MTNKKNKHLTYDDRLKIEKALDDCLTFTAIGELIEKDRTTVSKEIKKHLIKKNGTSFNNSANKCKNRFECKKFDCTTMTKCYEDDICLKITGTPYVCNGCSSKNGCRKEKQYYHAIKAEKKYQSQLSESRIGINTDELKIYELGKMMEPLIKKNLSLAHIYLNHPDEITFSRTTMYNYINLGLFSFKNIDLNRKVVYKKRKNNSSQKIRRESHIRKGRTYEDFSKYIAENSETSIVEMDTVEGKKGGKVFLTLYFRRCKLMLMYIMTHKNMECVTEVFDIIKSSIGIEEFKRIFEVILTDNGSEFFNPLAIELDEDTGEKISNVFYCDPSASYQKGGIEKNHEFIRYILPKGTSFDELTQEEATLIANNINNYSRDSLNGETPYRASKLLLKEETLIALKMKEILADDVNLSKSILKVKQFK